jgi:Replication protein A OB domain
MVDVLGVVERCDPSYNLQLRNGTDAQKRSLVLKDASNKTVEVTILHLHTIACCADNSLTCSRGRSWQLAVLRCVAVLCS